MTHSNRWINMGVTPEAIRQRHIKEAMEKITDAETGAARRRRVLGSCAPKYGAQSPHKRVAGDKIDYEASVEAIYNKVGDREFTIRDVIEVSGKTKNCCDKFIVTLKDRAPGLLIYKGAKKLEGKGTGLYVYKLASNWRTVLLEGLAAYKAALEAEKLSRKSFKVTKKAKVE